MPQSVAHISCGNWQKDSQMSDLKDLVIAAHGGLGRWNRLSKVGAHLETAVNPETMF